MTKKILLFLLLFLTPTAVFAALIPNDPFFIYQDYLKSINAQEAWDIADGEGVVIAVLDSGVDINHPDLRDNIWINSGEILNDGIDNDHNGYIDDTHGWDFIAGSNDPNPKFTSDCLSSGSCTEIGINHGTIIAGVIAAVGENRGGIIGLAHNAKIMPLRVLNEQGVGDTEKVVQAINYAILKKADIINLSLSGITKSENLENALKRAYKRGILVVAAAGNDALSNNGIDLDITKMYPVCDSDARNIVLGVGALDNFGKKLSFSNYGAGCVDISAAGERFYSSLFYLADDKNFSDYYGGWWSGTSGATALVSGAAGLVKSANPNLIGEEIMNILIDNSNQFVNLEKKYSDKMGSGALNVYNAVKAAAKDIDLTFKKRNYKKYLLTAPSGNFSPIIKTFNLSENSTFLKEFLAYDKNFRGGVNVATGDIDGDGIDEIIAGAGNGGGPHIRVFDQLGRVKTQFFAYDKNFRGGVNVATGDIDGDGIDEIIAGAGNGGGPYVKMFNKSGGLITELLAFGQDFQGGVKSVVLKVK
ncbi:S8 family serine peptidase [Candidatus Parcubacteria bacterium]|nr:S8 family serine peptidase [Candidatus Parcubacteria bacterium]